MVDESDAERQGNKCLLLVAMISFTLFAICEIVFAKIANSESLMGDALTMIVDGISYGLNLWAEEAKQDKSVRTQLWIDTLSPAVSTVALVGITIYVMIDAVDRLKEHDSDEEVNARVMWIFAAINLVLDFGNIALFFVTTDPETGKWKWQCRCSLSLCGNHETGRRLNLNMLSALAHVAADTLRSIAVMVAGLVTQHMGPQQRQEGDAIGAIIVSVAIAGSVFPLLCAVISNLAEIYSGDGYSLLDPDDGSKALLEYNDAFASDSDEEEIVPWRPSS